MPLTLDALAILDTIDRKGSFARAAEELARRIRGSAG
jgi:DNA-binding transcriptional LysR family regulator